MNPVIAIRDAYEAHVLLHFGASPKSVGVELPAFLAMETPEGLKVASNCSENEASRLVKAMEVYAEAYGVPVSLHDFWYYPASLAA